MTKWTPTVLSADFFKKVKVAHTRLPSQGSEADPGFRSQPAGDVSHKPSGRLPLLSVRPAVTPATHKRAATNFAAWWTEASWVWTVCLTLLPDCDLNFCAWVQHANHSATEPHNYFIRSFCLTWAMFWPVFVCPFVSRITQNVMTGPILSVFPALIVHSDLKSVHPGFPVAFIF